MYRHCAQIMYEKVVHVGEMRRWLSQVGCGNGEVRKNLA